MNVEELQYLTADLKELDKRIAAMESALEGEGFIYNVTGRHKFGIKEAQVEITQDMAEPFLRIGLRSLQRKRSEIQRRVREL